MSDTKTHKLTKSPLLNFLLGNMGIFTPYQVVNHLPRRYDDYHLTNETDLVDKQRIVIYGKLVNVPRLVRTSRIKIVTFDVLTEKKHFFKVVAFNREFLLKSLNLSDYFTFIGVYNKKNNEINLINFNKGQIPPAEALKPIYQLPSDYQNYLFHNLVNKSLEELKGNIGTLVPYHFVNKYRLVDKETALNMGHNPKDLEDIRQSYRYLKYEEALVFSLKNQLIREENKSLKKVKKEPIDLNSCDAFLKTLPYQLTDDQIKASEEIIEDMNQVSLMYRLLQGDVGTGKTLVSFIALYANYVRGDQGALLAPTDVLARQHYKNAIKIFEKTNLKIALLVGNTSAKEKKEIYRRLEEGDIDIVIGTHALFAKAVVYSSLGLVIIDEQHRFGVNQRKALLDKGDRADLLMMSATPIPRSLALSIYGDLEISTLYSFPYSKRDVTTRILPSDSAQIYKLCEQYLSKNNKVYVVAPLIEFREDGKYSVEQLYARFVLKFGKKVGFLHGKMTTEEKEKVLNEFATGDIDILVSTQVIEVGIDVKTANLMLIYEANSYGLASLHQLRGRIGRNSEHGDCVLVYDKNDEEDLDRLQILVDSNDGFEIAEKDLSLRGPGELTGIRQSGLPNFQYLNVIDDIKIFVVARDDAKYIIEHKDEKGFSYIYSRCKQEIEKEPLIKA